MVLSDKLYAALRHDQRAAAVVAAIARSDELEIQRLFATAAKSSYRGPDQRFVGNLRAIERFSMATALEIQTQTVHWMSGLAFSEAGLRKGTEEAILEVEGERGKVELARRKLTATWHAYVDTCTTLGLDPYETMCSFGSAEAAAAGIVIGAEEPEEDLFLAAKEKIRVLVDSVW